MLGIVHRAKELICYAALKGFKIGIVTKLLNSIHWIVRKLLTTKRIFSCWAFEIKLILYFRQNSSHNICTINFLVIWFQHAFVAKLSILTLSEVMHVNMNIFMQEALHFLVNYSRTSIHKLGINRCQLFMKRVLARRLCN